MAIFQLNNGVRIAGNDPIDYDRYIADDLTARDQLITDGRAHVGLQVYVSGVTNKLYILKDFTPTWEEVGGAADISSLSTVISIETSDRISGETSLSTAITNIPTYDDSSLSTAVSTEISYRTSGDQSLSTAISSVSGNTFDIDSIMDNGELLGMVGGELTGISYSTVVSLEASIRASSDESLSTAIGNVDMSSLSSAISQETTGRTSADSSLSTAINTKLSGLTSNILFWNSATTAYTPYIDNTSAGSAGKFYLGGTFLTAGDLRLNYTGGIYTNSSGNTGLYGKSTYNTGVVGESTSDIGVYGVSINSTGGRFITYSNIGNAIEAEGNNGVGASIMKTSLLITDDNTNLIKLSRTNDGNTLYSISGDIINITDNPTNVTYVSGSTLKATIDSVIRIDMNPRVSNSGTSVAYMFDTNTELTESGAKLLSLRNNNNEKFYVDYSGNTYANGILLGAGITPTNNIFFWDSGTSAYTPYSSSVTAGSAGKFYSGNTFITAADKRLNYTGGLSVNSISNAAIHGYSTSYAGIYGLSDTNNAVMGISTSGTGGYFTTSSYRGIQVEGGSGISAWIMKSATLTANDSNNLLYLTRQTGGNFNKTGDIININDGPSGTGTVSGSILKATIDSTIRVNINPRIANGASAVAYMLDTNTGLTTTGAKLVSIKNYGVEKFYVDWSGNTVTTGNIISTNTRKITLFDITSGTTSIWDMNSGCSARLYLTGATTLSISNTVSGDNGTLIAIQGTSGNIIFPTNSKYAGGTPHTLSGGGQLDILSFYYDGTNYYWNIGKNYA